MSLHAAAAALRAASDALAAAALVLDEAAALATPPAPPEGILADLLAVFAAAGDPERMRTAEILAGLAALDSATWSAEALDVDAEDAAAYVRTGGTELRKVIDAALDGTGRELAVRGWSAGGRANGYYLAAVRAATCTA